MNKWSKAFGVKLPNCNQCGICCQCASPSVPLDKLLEKAASGDDFAQDFLNIFIPYENFDEARALFPDITERGALAVNKNSANTEKQDKPVFYKCKYHCPQKQCLIYEDRPTLCREFPHSPFAVLDKCCGYYNWAMECREKYKTLKEELNKLNEEKKELENLKIQRKALELSHDLQRTPEECRFMRSCPSLSLISPASSVLR